MYDSDFDETFQVYRTLENKLHVAFLAAVIQVPGGKLSTKVLACNAILETIEGRKKFFKKVFSSF